MTTASAIELLAADRIGERQRQARTARLAALARCCQPGTWGRAARRVAQVVVRVRGVVRRDRRAAAGCCA